jgi:hypothetical protein
MRNLTPQQRNAIHVIVGLLIALLLSFASLNFFPKLSIGIITVFILGYIWEENQVYITQNRDNFDWWDIVRAEIGFIIGLIIF